MTRNFTFFAAMILATMSIFAQKPLRYSSNEAAGSFLKSRFDQYDNRTDRNPAERETGVKYDLSKPKSAEAIKQRLDSYEYKYYDAISSKWIPEEKGEFTYDANWNNTYEKGFTWDGFISQWIEDWRSENAYDASGNLVRRINSRLNELSNQFVVSSKSLYTYDSRGNLTQQIRSTSNGTTLVESEKYVFTYDASDNLTQEIYYQASGGNLRASDKYDYTYDANGREFISIYSYWSGIEWILREKNESTYNSNGNITLYTGYSWDLNNNKWSEPDKKTEYSYNASGKLTQKSRFVISEIGSNWIPESKLDWLYDANGNNTQMSYTYSWDSETKKWTEGYKDEYTLNTNYTFNDLILPYWFEYDLNSTRNMVTELKSYDWNSTTQLWDLSYNGTYNYSEQNFTSVNPKAKDIVSVYPNPFTEAISIAVPASYTKITFDLFDQQGRKLMTKQISADQKISLEDFNTGMYMYKLNIDGKIQSGKLVKK